MNSASARASSVLPTPVGPRKTNEPIGRFGSWRPGARAAERVRDRRDGLVLADDALVQPLLHVDQLLRLALEQPRDGDAGPARDDRGDVVLVDLLLDHRARPAARARASSRSSCGQLAVADLGDALEVALALGALGLHAQLVDPLRDLADALECLLLLRPAGGELVAALLRLGELALDAAPRVAGSSLAMAASSISSWRTRRSASSSSSGEESISIRRRDAASSTRSIALSGRNRSAM